MSSLQSITILSTLSIQMPHLTPRALKPTAKLTLGENYCVINSVSTFLALKQLFMFRKGHRVHSY